MSLKTYLISILWHDAIPIVSSTVLCLFSFPLSLSPLHLSHSVLFAILFLSFLPSLHCYRSSFLCLSPGRRKEALQEIHLQRHGTVQQNTNDIFTWRRGRNWRDGFTRERFIERYARGETQNVFFERNALIHSRSRAEVRSQFLPSSVP